MSDNVNISFIPKKPLAQSGGFRKQPVFGISFVVSVTISFALIGYSTFLYFQTQSLEETKQQKISNLIAYQEDLEEDDIINDLDNLRNTANQINQAKVLLRNHIALTDLFSYIGTLAPNTLKQDGQIRAFIDPVVFNSFSFNRTQEGVVVTMDGSAHSYGALAALSKFYKEKRDTTNILKDFTLSGFSPISNGRYTANLSVTLDPKLISYQCVYGDEDMKSSASCSGNNSFQEMGLSIDNASVPEPASVNETSEENIVETNQ